MVPKGIIYALFLLYPSGRVDSEKGSIMKTTLASALASYRTLE